MAECDRCHVSIGWFSKRKIVFPDGRKFVVCPSCAAIMGPEVELARRALPPQPYSIFSTLSGKPIPVASDPRDAFKDGFDMPPAAANGTWTVTTTYESKTATGQEGAAMARDLIEKMRAQPGLPDDALRQLEAALGHVQQGANRLTLARIVGTCVERFRDQTGIDVSDNAMAMQRLTEAGTIALQRLADHAEYEVNVPYLSADATGPKHLVVRLKREDFLA